jgi:hypothetical protein
MSQAQIQTGTVAHLQHWETGRRVKNLKLSLAVYGVDDQPGHTYETTQKEIK